MSVESAVPNGVGEASLSSPPLTTRVPQLSTELVDVWRTIIHPNQPLKMHRHAFSRLIIPLMDATLLVRSEAGKEHTLNWKKGNAYYLDADPIDELHIDINMNGYPVEVMVVQFKERQTLQPTIPST